MVLNNITETVLTQLPKEPVDLKWVYTPSLNFQVLLDALYGDYRGRPYLNLLDWPTCYLLTLLYLFLQLWAVFQYTHVVQYLRHPVIWEHSELSDIHKLSASFAIKFGKYVTY